MPDPRDPSVPRADQTLSSGGLIALAVVLSAVTVVVAVGVELAAAVRAADRAGATLLLRTEAWLDRVDAELAALETADPGTDGCSPADRDVLLRASLHSAAVQAFVRIASGGERCGPSASRAFVDATDGLVASPVQRAGWTAVGASRPFVLHAASSSFGGVLATRAARDGSVRVALLEPRWAIDAPGAPSAPAYAIVVRQATPFVLLEGGGPRAATRADGVGIAPTAAGGLRRVVHDSTRWPISVSTAVDARAVGVRLRDAALGWAALGLMLVAGGAALAQQHMRRRDRPEVRLRRALRKRRFEPAVQPIVEARSGRCVGVEVLLRLSHPVRGPVSPVEFIALAEATGLITPIFELLVAKARDQLAPIARRYPDLVFAFNLAPSQLQDPGLADRLTAAFDDASLQPARILLEITERDLVDDVAARGVAVLRERGFRVAIDDFGTGQSSLATLERLRVDRIKIDREFVRRIDEPDAGTVVLDAIIGLAQRLGTPLVAEGVETDTQRRWLADRGVDCLQGYFFARPMTVGAFAAWIDGANRDGASVPTGRGRVDEAAPPDEPRAALASQGGAWFAWGAGARVAALDPERVAAWMRGVDGVDLRDRYWGLRTWPCSFVGREAVDWLVARFALERAQAVRLGQRMAALGLIEHVAQEHDFADAMLFYRFRDPAAEVGAPGGVAGVDLRALIHEMRGVHGVQLLAHDWRGVRYRRAFTGARATRWLQRHLGVDRDAAEAVARALLRTGAIRHVDDERGFRSNREPFRFG
jgi:EAL domain-containing protein (putative c-di-GMP-specific phosphodiesterase class I)